MKLTDIRRLSWDTETTGVDPHEARIVTAAIVVRGGDQPDRTLSWLANPGIPIPAAASAVHGITDAKAQAEGQHPKIALGDIADKLTAALRHGMPVIAYNHSYDWTVLNTELARHNLPTMTERLGGAEPFTLLDPHVIDKRVDRYRKGSRKLKATCAHYGVDLDDWHTAEADALAALRVTDAVFDKFPELLEMLPVQLYAAQQRWRADQAASLQAWLRRTDPNAVVASGWPLIPRDKEAAAQTRPGEVGEP